MKEALLIKNKTYSKRDVLIRGIYFLILNKKIVYIGKASNSILERVLRHVAEDYKIFDSFQFVNCNKLSKSELNNLEIQYIRKHKPEYNKNYMITKGKYLTIRISEADIKRIKELAKKEKLSLTDYVLMKCTNSILKEGLNISGGMGEPIECTNETVPTKLGTQGSKGLSCDHKGKPNHDYVMAKNIRTKPPINIKSTEKVSIEQAGEKPEPMSKKTEAFKPSNTCASCSTEIKKGYLCKPCLIKT